MAIPVLLVDSDDDYRQLMVETLDSTEQFKSYSAASASEAITLLTQQTVQIAIVDVDLPDLDGSEFINELREIDRHLLIIAIVENEEKQAPGFSGASVAAVIEKPFFLPELPQIIQNAIRPPAPPSASSETTNAAAEATEMSAKIGDVDVNVPHGMTDFLKSFDDTGEAQSMPEPPEAESLAPPEFPGSDLEAAKEPAVDKADGTEPSFPDIFAESIAEPPDPESTETAPSPLGDDVGNQQWPPALPGGGAGPSDIDKPSDSGPAEASLVQAEGETIPEAAAEFAQFSETFTDPAGEIPAMAPPTEDEALVEEAESHVPQIGDEAEAAEAAEIDEREISPASETVEPLATEETELPAEALPEPLEQADLVEEQEAESPAPQAPMPATPDVEESESPEALAEEPLQPEVPSAEELGEPAIAESAEEPIEAQPEPEETHEHEAVPVWLDDDLQAGEYLTALFSEHSARGLLLLRDRNLWAWSQQFSEDQAQRVAQLFLEHETSKEPMQAIVRYIELDPGEEDVLLYAVPVVAALILILIYDADKPFGLARRQANSISERLLTTAPSEPAPQEPIPSEQEEPTVPLLENSMGALPSDWIPVEPASEEGLPLLDDLEVPPPDPEPTPEAPPTSEPQPLPADWLPKQPTPASHLPFLSEDELPGLARGEAEGSRAALQEPSYDLPFTVILLPRFPDHELDEAMAANIESWVRDLCVAWGWRADLVETLPQYLRITIRLSPDIAPNQAFQQLARDLSQRLLEAKPDLLPQLPSGQFWARKFLITAGDMVDSAQVSSFIDATRQEQGFDR